MKASDQIRIENAKNEMTLVLRRLRLVALGLAGIFIAIVGMVFLVSNANGEWVSDSTGLAAFCKLSGLMLVAMIAAIIMVAFQVSVGNRRADSPFSLAQSKRLFAIGVLLVVFAMLEAGGFAYVSNLVGQEGAMPFIFTSIQLAVIHIDILFILAAIVSFYLSRVFKYGAFLQWMYDETV